MGKAAFVHLSDGISRLQIYVRRQDVVGVRNEAGSSTNLSLSDTVDGWELFNLLDHGDFIGVEGYLFVTKTGELSVRVDSLAACAALLAENGVKVTRPDAARLIVPPSEAAHLTLEFRER